MKKELKVCSVGVFSLALSGCMASSHMERPLVPSIEYSKRVAVGGFAGLNAHEVAQNRVEEANREIYGSHKSGIDARAAMSPEMAQMQAAYGAPQINPRDYNGPLSLGDPGQTSSLWRESSTRQDFFRDVRAWQPMDLITVRILERTEGRKEADTETKSQSTVSAAIDNLFGLEDHLPGSDPTTTLGANTQNDFKGEGETTRRDSLTGSLSAMVAEVLPSGILRIEGTKIISVNNEEQIMVLTGLVRPRDITSDNEVDSTRVANMRIDYYGRGDIGDAQRQGWLGQIIRKVWPF
jgi:flagellar L-ring protein precursor FlgH